jgi:hypothetical protein
MPIGEDITPRLTSLANARPKTGNDSIIAGSMPTYPNQAWQAWQLRFVNDNLQLCVSGLPSIMHYTC